MEIIPDPTVMALQLIPFLVTLAALYKIILAPMLDYLEERQSAIESGTTGVDQMNADLEARAADYENQLKAARSAGAEIRGARRVEAKAGYDAHIATARGEAESQINEALVEIQASAGSAREELQGSSQVLAAQISSQVLGRPVA
jgi:F-type H+-transporting ATPase subunit b